MERYILTISSELFDDETDQEASVRKNVTVRTLIEEVRQEFNLPEGSYVIRFKNGDRALDGDKTLEELGAQTGSELVFERERLRLSQQIVARGGQYFQGIAGARRMILREAATGHEFPIRWQPAIIGRAGSRNPQSAEALAVNLGNLPEGRTVSRQHAQITTRDGRYYVEALSDKNPTFLNGEELTVGEKRALEAGDTIRTGKFDLVFEPDRT